MVTPGSYPATSRERPPSTRAEANDAWDAATGGLSALHRCAVLAYFRDGLNLGQTAIVVQRSPGVASRLVLEAVALIRRSGRWTHLAELTRCRLPDGPFRPLTRLPSHSRPRL